MSKKQLRSFDLLPKVFKTNSNRQFLDSTLDALVSSPEITKFKGFIGEKSAYGSTNSNTYVRESTTEKTNHQLTTAVVQTYPDSTIAKDVAPYNAIVSALKASANQLPDESQMFSQEFYSWDPLVNLDKLVNFAQYCWIPDGLEPVEVTASTIDSESVIEMTLTPAGYIVTLDGLRLPSLNPTLTLQRGGSYTFVVNQASKFYIQGEPGISVDSNVRSILGLTNNGASTTPLQFDVPAVDAQSEFRVLGDLEVDFVTNKHFDQINNRFLKVIGGIDGALEIDQVNGKTLMFTDSTDSFASTFYVINIVGDLLNPIVTLTPSVQVPSFEKITVQNGLMQGKEFFKDATGRIVSIPYFSSSLSSLYYQDATNPNCSGEIVLVDDTIDQLINVERDIIGKANFTSRNGVVFTNDLLVYFTGDVFPESYRETSFYVHGVGESIKLIEKDKFEIVEDYRRAVVEGFQSSGFNTTGFGGLRYVALEKDYIVASRQYKNLNSFSRGNWWFHIDTVTQCYTSTLSERMLAVIDDQTTRAKRPIVEFLPDVKMMASGENFGGIVDFFVSSDSPCLFDVKRNNVLSVSGYTVFLANTSGIKVGDIAQFQGNTSATIRELFTYKVLGVDNSSVTLDVDLGTAMFQNDLEFVSGTVSFGKDIVALANATQFSEAYVDVDLESPFDVSYKVFDGASLIFENDESTHTIYKMALSDVSNTVRVFTLIPESIIVDDSLVAVRNGSLSGKNFAFKNGTWQSAQTKSTVNQSPLFDIVDKNGVSFSDVEFYPSTNFVGTKLFSYTEGSQFDPELKLNVKFATLGSLGDILFTQYYNTDSFSYVDNGSIVTKPVSTGFMQRAGTLQNGWVTSVTESVQYQVIELSAIKGNNVVNPGVPLVESALVPVTKVYVNGVFTPSTIVDGNISFTSNVAANAKVMFLSKEKSPVAFFELPINLDNNPLNQNPSELTIGSIRRHFETIIVNSGIEGDAFNSNKSRDVPGCTKFGSQIVQHSASAVLSGIFTRNRDFDAIAAIEFSSAEYTKFKSNIIDLVLRTEFDENESAASMLDEVLSIIASAKTDQSPFFWTDMVASGDPAESQQFVVSVDSSNLEYRLGSLYNFTEPNYKTVYVYVSHFVNGVETTTQLLKDIDYTVSEDAPVVIIKTNIKAGSVITINEYDKTYGSFVPNTPAKFGLTKLYKPEVYVDDTYLSPTPVMIGHDGSIMKLFTTDFSDGVLYDRRDQVIFELEKRIFNNIKAAEFDIIDPAEITPGAFRNSVDASLQQLSVSVNFMNWVGKNRAEFQQNLYIKGNPFTFNYRGAKTKLGHTLNMGGWRGIYLFMFDTINPARTPWEMIGHTIKPVWWDQRYGMAPYTSDNLLLWKDMEAGIDWNNGSPIVKPLRKRPGLMKVLAVNNQGELLSPLDSVIDASTFDQTSMADRQWGVNDVGATEYAYIRSSSYSFDHAKLCATFKPAKFFSLFFDSSLFTKTNGIDQFTSKANSRSHSEYKVSYTVGQPQHGYVTWLVDYNLQFGINAVDDLISLLKNVDVRTVYRLSGFSDKKNLRFFIEKAGTTSSSKNLLIPDENFSVILHENVAADQVVYSSVIVERTARGYRVWGNSQSRAFFECFEGKFNGYYKTLPVNGDKIILTREVSTRVKYVEYGHEFTTVQDLCEFVKNYMLLLESKGVIFDSIESGLIVNGDRVISELITWVESGWAEGSILSLNPAANRLKIKRESLVVQPLTLHKKNFVLNQNAIPISIRDLCVHRDMNEMSIEPLNNAESIAFGVFNLSSIEHVVVFDNTTIFGDIIRNNTAGIKQPRLIVDGSKTANWTGKITTDGFILNQDNVVEWEAGTKYSKGTIVKYKNQYWAAKTSIQPSDSFNLSEWAQTEFEEIQKGLLPNASARALDAAEFYELEKVNLDRNQSELALSLIGFRKRDYLTNADLSDVSHAKVFTRMIREKGTSQAANLFKNAELLRGSIDYDIHESFAIKLHTFGGVDTNKLVDFSVESSLLTDNPSIISFYTDKTSKFAHTNVDVRDLISSSSRSNDLDIFPTKYVTSYRDSSGYATPSQVDFVAFDFSTATKQALAGQTIQIANYLNDWNVYQYEPVVSTQASDAFVVRSIVNGNETVSFAFSSITDLAKNDIFLLTDFGSSDGYYRVLSTKKNIVVCEIIAANAENESGQGIALKLKSLRLRQLSDVPTPSKFGKFAKSVVFADELNDRQWGVVTKSLAFSERDPVSATQSEDFGAFIAQSESGVFSVDPVNETVSLEVDGTIVSTIPASGANGIAVSKLVYVSSSSGVTVYHTVNSVQLASMYQVGFIPSTQTSSVSVSGDGKWVAIASKENKTVKLFTKSETLIEVGESTRISPNEVEVSGDITSQMVPGTRISFTDSQHVVVTSNFSNGKTTIKFVKSVSANVDTSKLFAVSTTFTLQSTIANSVAGFASSVALDRTGEIIVVGASDRDGVETNEGTAFIYSNVHRKWEALTSGTFVTSIGWTVSSPLVYHNGVLTSEFSIAGQTLTVNNVVTGDIISVHGGRVLQLTQVFPENPNNGSRFGASVAVDAHASQFAIGSVGQVNNESSSGAVYVYEVASKRTGTVTIPVAAMAITINGFGFTIDATKTAQQNADRINAAKINNIAAVAVDDEIVISVRNKAIGDAKNLLSVLPLNQSSANVLNFSPSLLQILTTKQDQDTQFGSQILFTEVNSLIVSGPNIDRDEKVSFDFTLDRNTTYFVDVDRQSGAVLVYDFLESSDKTTGRFVLGQELYNRNSTGFGRAICSHGNQITVSSKTLNSNGIGQTHTFKSEHPCWNIISEQSESVAIDQINAVSVYDTITNETISYLDVIDPVQGKFLSVVHENADFICFTDPADYKFAQWGSAQVGKIWVNLASAKFINCYQSDELYASENWGQSASKIEVFTWVESSSPESEKFVSETIDNTTKYYGWKVTGEVGKGKTLSDKVISEYATDPQSSGISFCAFVGKTSISLYNIQNTQLPREIGVTVSFVTKKQSVPAHTEFALIKADGVDFFNATLYQKLVDSLVGVSTDGVSVPDAQLPEKMKYGTGSNQSMFVNRLGALENYIQFVNSVIVKFPVVESKTFNMLKTSGEHYDTTKFFRLVNWVADGYQVNTKSKFTVTRFHEIFKLSTSNGDYVTVLLNSNGEREVYQMVDGEAVRVFLQNGTIQFNESIYKYTDVGFGVTAFNNSSFGYIPHVETRNIVRSINEELLIDDLAEYKNKALILLIEYMIGESANSHTVDPWIMKTSFIDVTHQAGRLVQLAKYQRDAQEMLEKFISEVKPYHVVVKDFKFKYSGGNEYQSITSDFDLPAALLDGEYITPDSVRFDASSDIWKKFEYSQYNENYGFKFKNNQNIGFTTVAQYVNAKDSVIYLTSTAGLPVNGTITINSERISYFAVDHSSNSLVGVIRGASPKDHDVGSNVSILMPAVCVVYGGRGYTRPPVVRTNKGISGQAKFSASIANGSVSAITVNSSARFLTRPELSIESAFSVVFDDSNIKTDLNVIVLPGNELQHTDIVKFTVNFGNISPLKSGTYFYVGVLGTTESEQTIGLYRSLHDCLTDSNRIVFNSASGTFKFEMGAIAFAFGNSSPIRQMKTTMRFDRTIYRSIVSEFIPGTYYAGSLKNTLVRLGTKASSSQTLFSAATYLNRMAQGGSGSGAVFNIQSSLMGTANTAFYHFEFTNRGDGYAIGDIIRIRGDQLGGATPQNDLEIRIEDVELTDIVNSTGRVSSYTVQGTVAKLQQYETDFSNVPTVSLISSGTGLRFNVSVYNQQVPPASTYSVTPEWTGGFNYAVGDVLTIPGSELNGDSSHDCTIVVKGVTVNGSISSVDVFGYGNLILRANYVTKYNTIPGHFTVVGSSESVTTKLEVAYNGTVSPSEISSEKIYFNERTRKYEGVPITTITGSGAVVNIYAIDYSDHGVLPRYTVQIAEVNGIPQTGSGYKANQTVRIPGSMLGGINGENDCVVTIEYVVSGQIAAVTCSGQSSQTVKSYFAKVVSNTEIELYNDSIFASPVKNFDVGFSGTVFGFVNEFANYEQGLVLFNGTLYRCVESNNDIEFDFDKWEEVSADDLELNALDRITAFYAPSVGMPAKNLNTLLTGLTDPVSSVEGYAFDTSDEVDSLILANQFSTDNFTLNGIVAANGKRYSAVQEGSQISVFALEDQWVKISTVTLDGDLKAFVKNSDQYIVVTTDRVFQSFDLVSWNVASDVLNRYNGAVVTDTLILFGDGIEDNGVVIFDDVEFTDAKTNNGQLVAVGYRNGMSLIVTKVGGAWSVVADQISSSKMNAIGYLNGTWVVSGELTETYTSQSLSVWDRASVSTSNTINSIVSGNNILVMVGEGGEIISTLDAIVWNRHTSQLSTASLNFVSFTDDQFIATGAKRELLISTDGTTWVDASVSVADNSAYEFVSPNFAHGFAPEELVAGTVTDSCAINAFTRPSGDFGGLRVATKSNAFKVEQVVINSIAGKASFSQINTVAFTLDVFLDGTRLTTAEYSIDWKNQTIQFTDVSDKTYTVIVYSAGGGNCLQKSSSNDTPFVNGTAILDVEVVNFVDIYHPIFKNGQELSIDSYNFGIVGSKMSLTIDGLLDTDYVAFAIMGEMSPEVIETSFSPSIQLSGALVDLFTVDTGVIQFQDEGTSQFVTMSQVYWTVSSGVVTITKTLLPSTKVRLTIERRPVASRINSSTAIVVLPDTHSFFATLDSFAVFVDGVRSTYTLNSNVMTINGVGTNYTVLHKTASVPVTLETTDLSQIQGTVSQLENAIVYSNGLVVDHVVSNGMIVASNPTAITLFDGVRSYAIERKNYQGPAQIVNSEVTTMTRITTSKSFTEGQLVAIDNKDSIGKNRKFRVSEITSVGGLFKMRVREEFNDQITDIQQDFTGCFISDQFEQELQKIVFADGKLVTVNDYADLFVLLEECNQVSVIAIDRASPDEFAFRIKVDKNNTQSVNKITHSTHAYTLHQITPATVEIFVNDVMKLVKQTNFTGVVTNNKIELNHNRHDVNHVTVFNKSTKSLLDEAQYSIDLVDLAPVVVFNSGVSDGDLVEVRVLTGNRVVINSEEIRFTKINVSRNSISGLFRGTNHTSVMTSEKNSKVIAINGSTKLNDSFINKDWGSYELDLTDSNNSLLGDPLNISSTEVSRFIRS